ncbi:unnamed protein product [Blepharisma stoltei]|uniref:Uncharacterized protein n=1 Tax=Blepharisma stoltei TaxID=1481888 RepID=A0AAU9JSE1_9CILI|nr:unnamed protein product [Blepharisma stoltei]
MEFLLLGFVLALLGVLAYFFILKQKPKVESRKDSAQEAEEETKEPKASKSKSKMKPTKKATPKVKCNTEHRLYKNAFKGFHEPIKDFDIKPGYIGVCCRDGQVKIFKINNFEDQNFKFIQGKLEREEPSAVAISVKGDTLVAAGSFDHKIHYFVLKQEKDKKLLVEINTFSQQHTYAISDLACTPNCIISSGDDMDTTVNVWSHSGDILATYDMKQLKNKRMAISGDFKFFSIATWIGSAKVIEIVSDKKTGAFSKLSPAMDLSGGSQGLACVGFRDSNEALTCCLDGKVKYWNINVRYQLKEHPIIISQSNFHKEVPNCCTISENYIVFGYENKIMIYSKDFMIVDVIENAHANEIRKMVVYENYLLTVASDARVNVWALP